jgi:phosphoribosylanthranilate isomerase
MVEQMKTLMIKVCGLTNHENIEDIASLHPDYMGFILFPGSPRYVSLETTGKLVKNIPPSIQKVGVLVNEPIENATRIAQRGFFDLLQLHGNENIDYCRKLSEYIGLIKVFSVSDILPSGMSDYQEFCKLFLFDTTGEKFGGNGKSFDHTILLNYSLDINFILGGGISPNDSAYLKSIKSDKLVAIDLNSRFEVEPGIKDINLIKRFIEKIRNYDTRN